MLTVSTEHISKTPGVCGGKACIAGHRIRVMDVMIWHEMSGMTPAQIVEQYPTISVADVHAAIAYYLDHREEIEADIRRGHEVEEKYRQFWPSKVQAKLAKNSSYPKPSESQQAVQVIEIDILEIVARAVQEGLTPAQIAEKYPFLVGEQEGLTPAQIAEKYPILVAESMQAVLAFYRQHRVELDAERDELNRQDRIKSRWTSSLYATLQTGVETPEKRGG
ncbi:DUF433 domain-containing protein [Urbifossiella limnaea]|uniref:DUF433 domain-containing protein n=1 Tax=Urbifossiella limnaea TaxID=2528023 RepID=A0A517XKU1_9BACT|nr:DUF433 domain-containing protein [Urbifossiella limnaea]QDU18123.1 hypothetical protein ETAA1_00060 [Urbifossiella limnaea]